MTRQITEPNMIFSSQDPHLACYINATVAKKHVWVILALAGLTCRHANAAPYYYRVRLSGSGAKPAYNMLDQGPPHSFVYAGPPDDLHSISQSDAVQL